MTSSVNRRNLERLDCHGNEAVIAKHANKIDRAIAAKARNGSPVQCIGYRARQVQFACEEIDKLFILGLKLRGDIFFKRVDDVFRQAGRQRWWPVCFPFKPGIPDPRCRQDRQFGQARGQG